MVSRHTIGQVAVPALPIELDAITLRPLVADDYADFCTYRSRADVARYVRWAPDDPEAVRREAFDKRLLRTTLDQPGDILTLAIVDRPTGRLAGEVMLRWVDDEHRQGEVGFGLHPDFHGRGLARAAAGEMLRVGFGEVGLHRIYGGCDPRNGPSAGLMRRFGMREEGILREVELLKGEWVDEQIFALLADEWRRGQEPPA
jgi:RimJ/RimL family protein N-acetyltransferase